MWFKQLVGFEEESPENVRKNIIIDGDHLISKVNGKAYQWGSLEVPTLEELRNKSTYLNTYKEKLKVHEIIGDIQEIHCDPRNKNALFQAASQFNLLEMVGPYVTPEKGVDIYERDKTQGPACAIACGAGTIYRNYFVPVGNQLGQTENKQIDCLELIGEELNNVKYTLWEMSNGYALPSQEGLLNINAQLARLTPLQREHLKGKLKIGIQWNTEVTLNNTKQIVSQAYCSALPVAYSSVDPIYWESFARLVLEASYEATLHAALINYERTGCKKVFLTLLGGGAFGNDTQWIMDALGIALNCFKNTPLEVGIVSYGRSKREVVGMFEGFQGV